MRSERLGAYLKVLGGAGVLFVAIAVLTAATGPLSSDPPAPWPAQHVIYPDYPAPVSTSTKSPSEVIDSLDPAVRESELGVVEIGRGDAYESVVARDRPDAYWRLGQQPATPTAIDRIGEGTHSSGVEIERETGTENVFASYGSPDDYSTLKGAAESIERELTIEVWLRNESFNQRSIPLSKGFGRTEVDSSWWLEWRADNRLAFAVWTQDGGFAQSLSTTSYDRYWHHVVGTYDGKSVTLYVDGALAGRARLSGPVNRSGAPVTLGNVASRPPATSFRGDLDEVALYDHVLPASSIEKHYTAAATTLRAFSADTIFWDLLPSSWRSRSEWQLSFPEGASVLAVFAEGQVVSPTTVNREYTYLDVELPDVERTYSVPIDRVDGRTSVIVAGRGRPPPPDMTFYMLRPLDSAGDEVSQGEAWAEGAWWQRTSIVTVPLAIGLYAALAALVIWSTQQIKRLGISRRQWRILIAVLIAEACLAAFTTNLDLQIFKGVAERYWILEPIRGLTLSGYGPVMDAVFVLPMLPYLMIAELFGISSEFGLNLAMRLPMLVGTYFLIGSTARLATLLRLRPPVTNWIFYGLVINPVVMLWSLWHPESLVVGTLVLSIALMLENRFAAAGAVYGLSVTSKYWPLFVGPLIAVFLIRTKSRTAAAKWLFAGAGVTVLLSALYWAPTFASLSSLDEARRLLTQRLPYFGGAEAESYATIWSLYDVPRDLLDSQHLQSVLTTLEGVSFLMTLGLLALGVVLFMLGRSSFERFCLVCGAVLAGVAGINSLSVVGFALWSLPFLLVGTSALRRRRLVLAVGAGAWCAGVFVAFVVEPVSYWLLHANEDLDNFALDAASWLNTHLVNFELARAFGFVFCLLMTLLAFTLLMEVRAGGRLHGLSRLVVAKNSNVLSWVRRALQGRSRSLPTREN